jgi:hypothetical protein
VQRETWFGKKQAWPDARGVLKEKCWTFGELKEQSVCFLCRPKFGGKYCTGERKRYRLCNVHPCRTDTPTFRQMQCSEFDTVPYKNEFYHWFPVFNPCKKLSMYLSSKATFYISRFLWCAPQVIRKNCTIKSFNRLTPVILATQETEIRRIMIQSQPGQIVCKTLSQKTYHKKLSRWSDSRWRPWVQVLYFRTWKPDWVKLISNG